MILLTAGRPNAERTHTGDIKHKQKKKCENKRGLCETESSANTRQENKHLETDRRQDGQMSARGKRKTRHPSVGIEEVTARNPRNARDVRGLGQSSSGREPILPGRSQAYAGMACHVEDIRCWILDNSGQKWASFLSSIQSARVGWMDFRCKSYATHLVEVLLIPLFLLLGLLFRRFLRRLRRRRQAGVGAASRLFLPLKQTNERATFSLFFFHPVLFLSSAPLAPIFHFD